MIIGEFINYYPAYTVESVLNMYAITFFSMLGAMYRLKGSNNHEIAYRTAVAMSGGDSLSSYMEQAKKQEKGLKGLLEEVRMVRKFKK